MLERRNEFSQIVRGVYRLGSSFSSPFPFCWLKTGHYYNSFSRFQTGSQGKSLLGNLIQRPLLIALLLVHKLILPISLIVLRVVMVFIVMTLQLVSQQIFQVQKHKVILPLVCLKTRLIIGK
jgi:hypothetical protein